MHQHLGISIGVCICAFEHFWGQSRDMRNELLSTHCGTAVVCGKQHPQPLLNISACTLAYLLCFRHPVAQKSQRKRHYLTLEKITTLASELLSCDHLCPELSISLRGSAAAATCGHVAALASLGALMPTHLTWPVWASGLRLEQATEIWELSAPCLRHVKCLHRIICTSRVDFIACIVCTPVPLFLLLLLGLFLFPKRSSRAVKLCS